MEAWPKKVSDHLIFIKALDKFYFTDYNLEIIDSIYIPVLKDFYNFFYLGDNRVLFSDNHHMFCYSLKGKQLEECELDRASFYPLANLFVKDVDMINKKFSHQLW